MTKISVIIPVYNTEKYLEKCLDSLFSQNFTDVEVICVDDGSTDNSLAFLRKYQNIVILKQENNGSGVARNEGLQHASGDYVLFVDSDDWVREDAFAKLFEAAERLKTDVLIFGGLTYSKNKLRKGRYGVSKIPHKYFNRIFCKKDFKDDIFKFPSTAWTKLYKREFLIKNNIKFQEIKVGQDQIFFLKSMLYASKIAVFNEDLYCYRKKRAGSVTSSKKKENFSPIEVFKEVELFAKEFACPHSLLNRYFLKATFWLPKMREDLKEEYYTEYLKLSEHVKTQYPDLCPKMFKVNQHDSYLFLKIKYLAYKLICSGTKLFFLRLI